MLKANAKKWVFSVWNWSIDWAALRLRGRLFQRLGAATAKALSPFVFSLHLGTSSSTCRADRNSLTGAWMQSNSDIYWGASPCKDLKANNRIFNLILKTTPVSQWREAWTGVMWSYLLFPVRRRAKVFCTSCRRRSRHWSTSKERIAVI